LDDNYEKEGPYEGNSIQHEPSQELLERLEKAFSKRSAGEGSIDGGAADLNDIDTLLNGKEDMELLSDKVGSLSADFTHKTTEILP